MYIKLIQPKMKKRPMDTDIKIRMTPPLGLFTVANILRSEHNVVIENENIKRINAAVSLNAIEDTAILDFIMFFTKRIDKYHEMYYIKHILY